MLDIRNVEELMKLFLRFRVIFIDDQIKNVQIAKELGMKGIHLDRNKDDLKSILGLD